MRKLQNDKWYNRFQYDVTYLVVIWERDNTGTDAKNHTWMNFAMCPSVSMGASFELWGWIKFTVVYFESAAGLLTTRVYLSNCGLVRWCLRTVARSVKMIVRYGFSVYWDGLRVGCWSTDESIWKTSCNVNLNGWELGSRWKNIQFNSPRDEHKDSWSMKTLLTAMSIKPVDPETRNRIWAQLEERRHQIQGLQVEHKRSRSRKDVADAEVSER